MVELTGCTIVSANYLPFARVLAASFRAQHPRSRFVTLLVDRIEGRFDPAAEPFEVLPVEELPTLPDPLPFLFKYTIMEANTAVKPYLLQHLLARGAGRVVYLDPDILLFRPLAAVERALEDSNIVLVPHLTAPIDDDRHPDELAVLRSGAYNLGFLGLADSDVTRAFLAWWGDRIFDRCISRVEEGLFVDQKWIDLVPGMFERVHILTHPGYDVAYWNLHERRVKAGDPVLVNGRPLVFFHYSGIDPERLQDVSRHQDRYRLAQLGEAAALFESYAKLVIEAGYREAGEWRYAFAAFDDGTPIPDIARDLYRRLGSGRAAFGNPFAVADGFKAWLNRPYGPRSGGLSRLLQHLWSTRPELQAGIPDLGPRSRASFARWLEDYGAADYGLAPYFLEPLALVLGDGGRLSGIPRLLRRRLRSLYASAGLRRLKGALKRRLTPGHVERLRRLAGPLTSGRVRRTDGDARFQPAPPALPAGVNVIAYLRAESGVGESARCLVRALEAAGVAVSLTDVELGVRSRRQDRSLEVGGRDHAVNLLVVNADQVDAVAEHLGPSRFAGHLNIGFWAWELEEFPDRWRAAFARFDELWTHSRFCLDAFAAVSPIPVRRLPLPVTVPPGLGGDRDEFGLPDDAFVVLSSFDFLSFFERKNPLALVEAFRRALGGRDDALLVLKTANSDFAPQRLAELERAIAGLPVWLVDRTFARDAMWRLLACCDLFASLHRSEGYGLALLEAMALGKPVLATHYSGNVDFMNPANSLPVGYRLVPLAEDAGPYRRGALWAEPDLDHAAELLRRAADDRAWAREVGEAARAEVTARLSPTAVAPLLRRLFQEALRGRRPRGSHGPALHPGG